MEKDGDYGYFSDDGKEYIVTTLLTPKPWLNYISNKKYGLVFSQNGSGFSFYLSVLLQRLSYYEHNSYVPDYPQTGKYIYIRDVESKEYWTLAPLTDIDEIKYDKFICKHGLGYSEIISLRNGIESSFRIFVPFENDNPVEIWTIKITNKSNLKRKLQIYPYIHWQLTGYNHTTSFVDKTGYIEAKYDNEKGYITVSMSDPESKQQYMGFMAAAYQPDGFDTRLNGFLGVAGSLHDPAAVRNGRCTNSETSCEAVISVLQKDVELAPGESREFNIIVGISFNTDEIEKYRNEYLKNGKIEDSFNDIANYYKTKIAQMNIETQFPHINRYLNIWLKYGLFHVLKWTRGLDRGYRDVLQDVMGTCSLWPKESREKIFDACRHQLYNGTAPRQWSDIGNHHDMRLYMDSTVWMSWAIEEYLLNTGDFSLLDEMVSYLDNDAQDSVMDHLLKGARVLYDKRGSDGLCLLGDGDWNDSLSNAGRKGKGQSIWLTCAAYSSFKKLHELAEFLGDKELSFEMGEKAAELKEIINRVGWNGDWYIYAINDDGIPIGEKNETEGKIHLNVQTWALFLNIAEDDKSTKLFDLIDNVLDTEFGPQIVYPAYKKYQAGIGRITGMIPGFFENGSVYSHGVAMKILADCVYNRSEKAMESFLKVTPLNPNVNASRTGLEPYGFTNFYIGPENKARFGQAPYSWFSGSIAWLHSLLYGRIIGFRPMYHGIKIQPCIPKAWDRVKMERQLRNARYVVSIENG
ncbi:MAG: hypothetical protein GWP06_15080, partial [Actinobacteria bacterium]|nr:hypothetical protein [Actinomycetota bacterium]